MRELLAGLLLGLFCAVSGYGAVLRVDDDNQTGIEDGSAVRPFRTVAAAIAVAGDGDEIRVAAGSYAGNLVVDTVALTLRGGYAGGSVAGYAAGQPGEFTQAAPETHVTTLQGDGTAAVLRFLRFGAVAGWTTVDGFRITGGTRGIHFDGTYPSGDFARFLITRNLIEGNGRHDPGFQHHGGGIALEGSEIQVTGNRIRNNGADTGAGIRGNGHLLLIHGNTIEGNSGYGDHGGGLWLAGDGTVSGNVVRNNQIGELAGYGWGGGILVVGSWVLSGNLVTGNVAPLLGGAVFVDEGAEVWLDHELYTGNQTLTEWVRGGAALYVDGAWDGTPSVARIRSSTFAYNLSPGTNGGNAVYVEGSTVEVVDSIFWGNSGGDDFYLDAASTLSVRYTLSQEGWTGTGNLSLDPLFANPAAGDYHLRSRGGRWDPALATWVVDAVDSPAIDAGDPASPYANEPAPNGGRINLGAYGNTPEASRTAGTNALFADGFESGSTGAWSAVRP